MLKHAFIISAHANFLQIKTLIESLSFGDVYLHIDYKSEELFKKIKIEFQNLNYVTVIENRVSVNWSGFSQVEATLNLLKEVQSAHKYYDYIHFMSGQDLLLMKQRELDQYLISNGLEKQYIEVNDIGNLWWRLKCYSFFRENPKNRTLIFRFADIFTRLLQIPFVRRTNFIDYDIYKGAQWFSITMDCMNYILAKSDDNFIKRFKYTACPDEHFFQVLIMNSNFKDRVLRYNSRFVIFDGLNASPRVLTMNEYNQFMNGEYMFARKFDLQIDENVIKKVLNN